MILFILSISWGVLGGLEREGHWCEGESQRNYEVVVSPRLVDSVPCLELYRSVHDAWLYDERRMQDEHGGTLNISTLASTMLLYFYSYKKAKRESRNISKQKEPWQLAIYTSRQ